MTNAEPQGTEPQGIAPQGTEPPGTETARGRSMLIGLAAAAVLLVGGAIIAFAGGDGDEDPADVLEQIFNNDERITSGVLDVSAEVSAEGDSGGTFSASLGGPFQGDPDDPNALPLLDLTASVSGEGFGQSEPLDLEGAVTVSEDNAFVTYQDQAYEVGEETFSQAKSELEAQAEATQGSDDASAIDLGTLFEQFDVDPTSWLTELENEGTEDFNGESAIHIHGEADVGQILSDLVNIGSQVPGAEEQGLSPEVLDLGLSQIEQVVSEASLDVYGAEDDRTLRGIDLSLSLTPPQDIPVGVDNVDIQFSVALSEVNEEQTVEAPTDAQPIEKLLRQFGVDAGGIESLEDLGNLGTGGLEGGFDLDGGGSGGGGSGSGGGGSSPDLGEYQQCIEEAGQDTAELLACGELLQ